MQEILPKIISKKDLTFSESYEVMKKIMTGEVSPVLISAFLVAMKIKGESAEEISGFAKAMREQAVSIKVNKKPLIDTCGTGGDTLHTINFSTLSALICAAGGIAVAKHGNKAVSSSCGSADILEQLGIPINLAPEKVKESIEKFNFGFLFAPNFHPAMKYAGPVRKELGVRTVFNILGPLCNPAQVKRQLIGVFSKNIAEVIIKALKNLGSEKVWVVHSKCGMDELSCVAENYVWELDNKKIKKFKINAKDLGLKKCELKYLQVKSKEEALQRVLNLINGKNDKARDTLLLNTAACFVIAGKEKNLRNAINAVDKLLSSGRVAEKVKELQNSIPA